MTRHWPGLLIGALALGGITVLCSPRQKTISCVDARDPDSAVVDGAEPFTDLAMASGDRFNLDPDARLIEFPGNKDIKAQKISYSVQGNTLIFSDRLGLKYVLNTKSGGLEVFTKAGNEGGFRRSARAICTGF
ncbi:MAG: hypothetical protein ACK5N0_13785 [Synechococcaceae cyanobacterium]